MKVVTAYEGSWAHVCLTGRLDGEWAEHLSDILDEVLRDGLRSVVLDLAEVDYISSPGTQMLARRYEDFTALRGELRVASPSPVVQRALTAVGMFDKLILSPDDARATRPRTSGTVHRLSTWFTRDSWRSSTVTTLHGQYETSAREPGASLACRLYGDPDRMAQGPLQPADCHGVDFPTQIFGLGIGAIGTSYEECHSRFGELMGVAGFVAYLPTDGALVPDYLVGLPEQPTSTVLASGLTCDGGFSHLVRFRPQANVNAIPLAELAGACLDAVGADAAGLVIVAETAGLVAAALRRSPALPGQPLQFQVPAVRDWLSLTPERTHTGTTTLAVGVVARRPKGPLAAHLRRLAPTGGLHGHFHAVVFSYRPVPQRTVALQAFTAKLFGNQKLRGVHHLLADDRGPAGSGDSEFLRGLCWAAPISGIV